jgi:dethiobiotin synthetase
VTRGWFVTGTNTGVGKTLVSVALTRALVAQRQRCAVMKPVAAGGVLTPQGLRNEDALELLAASNVAATYEHVNPWMLATAASPHLAARRDGVSIDLDRIIVAHAALAAHADVLVVEGAGGWYAPISATKTMADIARRLALPVVLVVGLRLGCLNHAMLTRAAIRDAALPFAGWIANKLDAEMPYARANIETLTERFGAEPLAVVPAMTTLPATTVPEWAATLAKNLLSA